MYAPSPIILSYGYLYSYRVLTLLFIYELQVRIYQLQWSCISNFFDSVWPPRTWPVTIPSTFDLRLLHCSSEPLFTQTLHMSEPLQIFSIHSITPFFLTLRLWLTFSFLHLSDPAMPHNFENTSIASLNHPHTTSFHSSRIELFNIKLLTHTTKISKTIAQFQFPRYLCFETNELNGLRILWHKIVGACHINNAICVLCCFALYCRKHWTPCPPAHPPSAMPSPLPSPKRFRGSSGCRPISAKLWPDCFVTDTKSYHTTSFTLIIPLILSSLFLTIVIFLRFLFQLLFLPLLPRTSLIFYRPKTCPPSYISHTLWPSERLFYCFATTLS